MDNYKIVALSGWKKPQDVKPIFERIVALTEKKKPHVVYIGTGGRDREKTIPKDVAGLFKSAGCTVEEKSICVTSMTRNEIKVLLDKADILYEGGGDLRYLMTQWEKFGVLEMIVDTGRRGAVLCGASTGAMCWTTMGFDDYGKKRQIVKTNRFPFFQIRKGFEFIPAIGLLPFGMCPHFESPFWNNFCKHAEKAPLPIPFFAAENNAAILYDNGHYEILYGDPAGKIFLFDNIQGIFCQEVTSLDGILN